MRPENHSTKPPPPSSLELLQTATTGLYTPGRLAIVLAVQALLLAGLVVDSWHASPDSAAYLGLARSIAEGDGFTFNHEPHVHYPPLYPALLAVQTRLFGHSYLGWNACQAAITLLAAPLVFRLLRRLYGADLALLGTGLFALNFYLWRTASVLLSDPTFILLATAAMLATVHACRCGPRRWLAVAVAGGLLGAAALVRVNAPMLLPGILAALWISWRKRPRTERAAASLVLAAMSAGPILVWRATMQSVRFGEATGYTDTWYFANTPATAAWNLSANFFLHIPRELSSMLLGFGDVPPGVHLLLPVAVVVGCVVLVRHKQLLVPLALAPWVALLIPVPGIERRHLLFFAPHLYLLSIVGIVATVRRFRRRELPPVKLGQVVTVICLLLAAGHVGHGLTKLYRLRKASVPGGPLIGDRAGWFAACDAIVARPGPQGADLAVLTKRPGLVHFLTRARALPIKELGREGLARATPRRIRQYRPAYLLAESGHPITADALAAIRDAGARAEVVEGLKLTKSITLWRIVYPDAVKAPEAPARPGAPAAEGSGSKGRSARSSPSADTDAKAPTPPTPAGSNAP